jgi:plastocyanin
MRPRSVMLAALVIGSTAACGSSTSNPTGTTSSAGGGGGTSPNGPTTSTVSIVDYSFSPPDVTVKVGSTVEWTNSGSVAHTVTADDGSYASGQLASPTGGGVYGGGSSGGSYAHVFGSVGTFTYHCSNHTSMTGTITVTP